MRITSLHAALPLLLVPVLQAQNPPAPATITPRLDSPQARVIVATLQPRTPSIARTGHATDRVLVYLDDGVMTRKEGEQSTTIEFHRGDVRWRPASGPYTRRKHQRPSDPHSRDRLEGIAHRCGRALEARSGGSRRDALQGRPGERTRACAAGPLRSARKRQHARAHPEPRRGVPQRSARREGRRCAHLWRHDARGRERVRSAGRQNRYRVEVGAAGPPFFFVAFTDAETSMASTSRSTSLRRLMCRHDPDTLCFPSRFSSCAGTVRALTYRVRSALRGENATAGQSPVRPLAYCHLVAPEADDIGAPHFRRRPGSVFHQSHQDRTILTPIAGGHTIEEHVHVLAGRFRFRFRHSPSPLLVTLINPM